MKDQYPIAQLCLALGVSRSAFYASRQTATPSSRALENDQIAVEIATIHAQSRRTYGSPRIRLELRKSGRRVGRRRVARIMKSCRLFGRSRARRKWSSPEIMDTKSAAKEGLV